MQTARRRRPLFGSHQSDNFISAVVLLLLLYHVGGSLVEWVYFISTGHDRKNTPLGAPWGP
jgi:hypothetical protein